ncbi:hypothetical protein [Aeromonas caviae]|uniref:hypothetical protein n=1 Tax=Aeromonas caviae TaxID=648 RepID=UPI001117E537|nr:hypothetical protein [Aeromonas caviae]
MQIQEIQVVFNCIDRSTELSRSTSTDIKQPNQPHEISLVRLNFEDGSMYQVDDTYTVIQKGNFTITYLRSEPDNLVVHEGGANTEPAGYDGDVMSLLSKYKCPISTEQYIGMMGQYVQTMMKLKPLKTS